MLVYNAKLCNIYRNRKDNIFCYFCKTNDFVTMKNILKTWFKKGIFLGLSWLAVEILFSFKYIAEGDCAAIYYYFPMEIKDYFHVFIIGGVSMFLSFLFTRKSSTRTDFLIEGLIYILAIILVCYFGNDILASAEYYWPQHYHPKLYN